MSLRWDAQLPNTPSASVARSLRRLWEEQETRRQDLDHGWVDEIRQEVFFFALRECIRKCWSVTQGQCYINARSDIVVWVSNMLRKLYIREPFYTRQAALSHNIWQPVVRNLVLHFARRGYGVAIQGLLTGETNWTITINDTPPSPFCVPVAPHCHMACTRLRSNGRRRPALPTDLTERILLFLGRLLHPIHVGPQPDGGSDQGPARNQPWLWGPGWHSAPRSMSPICSPLASPTGRAGCAPRGPAA